MQISIELARPEDDRAIRDLVRREPVPGRISIRYEREPEFAAGCKVTGDAYRVVLARAGSEVAGVACRSQRECFVNGREMRIGYLGQLRVDRRYRGRWLVSRGFRLLRELHEDDPLPGYLAAIIDDNEEAAGILVQRPRKQFPSFHQVATYSTLAIPTRRGRTGRLQSAGMGEIVSFLGFVGRERQFFPVWTESRLCAVWPEVSFHVVRRGGSIAGVLGLWDQSSYKQTVIQGYSGWLKLARPAVNAAAALTGRRTLPTPGQRLRSAYASFLCVEGSDPDVFRELLEGVYSAASDYDFLILGLDDRDPLLQVAREYRHVLYRSRVFVAEWPGQGLHSILDSRPTYVEVATL